MLRIATLKDFKFIYRLFIQEARHRHFNHDIYSSFLKRLGFNRSEVMINILKSYNFKIDPRFAHPEMKLLLFTPR
ncbi:hypothetical protein CBW54_09460 [Yersinia kristensenii]|nr:hypothetical protein CBW54_09460 [Yersinia kristensenii]